MSTQGKFDLSAGALGIVLLVLVIVLDIDIGYAWVGYLGAAILIGLGIKSIITGSYKRR
jgi:hypothetical protein